MRDQATGATTKIAFPALGVVRCQAPCTYGPSLGRSTDTRAYALANGYWGRLSLYDSAGQAWSVSQVTPALSALARLLARTVYNPEMMVRITFNEPRPYQLEELKDQLIDLVNRDDDVLTAVHYRG